jgi:hypothetical protein
MDDNRKREIEETLLRRLRAMHRLYQSDAITMRLLGRQLVQLVGSERAQAICSHMGAKEMEARRLLIRMDDPDGWRQLSSMSEDRRRKVLPEKLVEVFIASGEPDESTLESLIDTANLPFFSGFVYEDRNDRDSGRRESRVSVLD